MTEPEDRESGAKTPEPSGIDPSRLPPRLREKLQAAVEEEPKKSSPVGPIVGAVVVVLVLVAAGWWFMHTQQVKAKAEAARVAAVAQAVADSVARVRAADSLAAVARADSIAAFNKLPKWKQRQILAQQARAAGGTAAVVPEEEGPFAIDAGEFLFEDKAQAVATELAASTGLEARAKSAAGGTYHVYVGRFDSRDAAAKAVNDLLGKHLLTEAHVVPAPRK